MVRVSDLRPQLYHPSTPASPVCSRAAAMTAVMAVTVAVAAARTSGSWLLTTSFRSASRTARREASSPPLAPAVERACTPQARAHTCIVSKLHNDESEQVAAYTRTHLQRSSADCVPVKLGVEEGGGELLEKQGDDEGCHLGSCGKDVPQGIHKGLLGDAVRVVGRRRKGDREVA